MTPPGITSVIACVFLALTTQAHAVIFNPLPGATSVVYQTNFSNTVDWDLSANSFVSHAQAPSFRPPAGSTYNSTAQSLEFGANGSAVLDLTGMVDPISLEVGNQTTAIYARIEFTSNTNIVLALGNDEAFAASPDPSSVVIESAYLRTGSSLISWGFKEDFNNPGDTPPPEGVQTTILPPYMTLDTVFDVAVLYTPTTVSVFTKEVTSSTWSATSGPAATLSQSFTPPKLAIYTPNDGTATIHAVAISIVPEPGSIALLAFGAATLIGLGLRSRVGRKSPAR